MKYISDKLISLVFFSLLQYCFVETVFAKKNEVTKVSIGNSNSLFGYYHSTPESPDGKLLVYTVINSTDLDRPSAELWICKTDLTNHRKITDIDFITLHNGAQTLWVDNNTLTYMEGFNSIKTISIDTKEIFVPIDAQAHLGHNIKNNKALAVVLNTQKNIVQPGLYELNPKTGDYNILLTYDDINKKYKEFVNHRNNLTVNSLWHPTYSPSGKSILLRVDVGTASNTLEKLLLTFDKADKDSISFISPTPLHPQWWNDDSIVGFNRVKPINTLLQWSKNGMVTEIIAGQGNHFTFDNNLRYIVSDSFYESSLIYLQIYERNNLEPKNKIYLTKNTRLVWDFKVHINPSFAQDSKRIYFNSVNENDEIHASFIYTSKYLGNK